MDVGSGFGKPVFHASMYFGCRGKGIEIVPARVQYCMDVYWQLDERYRKANEGKEEAKEEAKAPSRPEVTLPASKQAGKKRLSEAQKEERYELLSKAIEPYADSFEPEPNYSPDWYLRTNFEVVDAGKTGAYTITETGRPDDVTEPTEHISHIYSYNKVMGADCL